MDKKLKYIISIIIFILVIIGISRVYNILNTNFQNDDTSQKENMTAQETVLNQATDFSVYNDNGEEVKLSSFKGKPIVINFWTTWCGYCKIEMKYFEELYNQYKDDVIFMMVNSTIEDDKQEVNKYIAEQGYTFPVYYDTNGSAITTYRITGYPITMFVNKDFEINRIHQGMINLETLQKNINNIM